MLDLGWQEFFLIATIAVVVVGPKDLPNAIRAVMQWIRKIRKMAREFQGSIEEIAREAELDEVRREATKLMNQDFSKTILDTVDTDREMTNSLKGAHTAAEAVGTPGKISLLGDNRIGGWDAVSVSRPLNSVDAGGPASTEKTLVAGKPAARALGGGAAAKPVRKRAAKPKATAETAAVGLQAASKRGVKATSADKLRKLRAVPKAKKPRVEAEGESAPDLTSDARPATPGTEA
jgi:sec-independent protein translocase protein TatB